MIDELRRTGPELSSRGWSCIRRNRDVFRRTGSTADVCDCSISIGSLEDIFCENVFPFLLCVLPQNSGLFDLEWVSGKRSKFSSHANAKIHQSGWTTVQHPQKETFQEASELR